MATNLGNITDVSPVPAETLLERVAMTQTSEVEDSAETDPTTIHDLTSRTPPNPGEEIDELMGQLCVLS